MNNLCQTGQIGRYVVLLVLFPAARLDTEVLLPRREQQCRQPRRHILGREDRRGIHDVLRPGVVAGIRLRDLIL